MKLPFHRVFSCFSPCKRYNNFAHFERLSHRFYCTYKSNAVYCRINELTSEKLGKTIVVKGWIRNVREQKTNVFIQVNDGSSLKHLQVIVESSKVEQMRLTVGSCVIVEGTLVESPASGQTFEIQNSKIAVVGPSDPESYPLPKMKLPMEYLREFAHLRPRTNTFGAIFRVRNKAAMAVHKFFQNEGFIYVHTPILTSNDCEGAGELFTVHTAQTSPLLSSSSSSPTPSSATTTSQLTSESPSSQSTEATLNVPHRSKRYNEFFNCPEVYLTVSGQLQAEIFASAFTKVYTFGPTFRAESSHTPRHLSEFWMVEPEVCFFDLHDNMNLAENFVKFCVNEVLSQCEEDLTFCSTCFDSTLLNRLKAITNTEFARLEYTEAVNILKTNNFAIEWGQDLDRNCEKYLTEEYCKKPVFVINYPKSIKPFYMRLNADNKTVAAMDLLLPKVGELIGGSQREERLALLIDRMKEAKMNLSNYDWYLDLRKFGSAPHSGFGMGFERFLMCLTGVENIKDTIPIPRFKGFCKY